jgi:hypothetical protein
MKQTNESKRVLFQNVKDGGTFTIGGMEFIKFPVNAIGVPVVAKNVLFRAVFGKNNNLAESNVLKELKKRVIPAIINEVGEENVLTFKTDLTAWDGLKPYEALESKISLVTMDFYRENVGIFDRHQVAEWWWLATPDSAKPHYNPYWILCVSPSGNLNVNSCSNDYIGVRPFLIFDPSIFGSSED